MAEKNSEKTFSYYLDEIANLAEFLKTYPEGSVSNNATIIAKNISELKQALRGIRLMLLFLSTVTFICIIVTIFSVSSSKFRSYFVDEKIALKDSLLNLNEKDNYIKYRKLNGKLITYSDLIKGNDSLETKLLKTKAELSLAKSDLELCNTLLKSAKSNEAYYKDNSKFYEDNYRYYEDLNSKRQLDDIKDLTKNIQNMKKVDSGKILLNVFRKNMKYDSKSKSWTIDLNRK